MKKRPFHWLIWTGVVILIIITLIAGALWMSGVPKGLKLSRLLQNALQQESFDGDLKLTASFQGNKLDIQTEVFRRTSEDSALYGVTVNGVPICFANHRAIFDNGRAFDLGTLVPQDVFDADQVLKILPFAGVKTATEGDHTRYFLKLDSSKIQMLYPNLSDASVLEAEFTEHNGALSQLNLHFTDGSRQADVTLCAVSERQWDLPAEVWNAVSGDAPQSLEVFAPLAKALISLSQADPLAAELAVTADCGPVALTDTMMLYRTDSGLYLQRKGTVNSLNTLDLSNQALLGLGYKFCRDGQFSHVGTAGIYSLKIPAESVEACCIEILPEIEMLPITYDDGSLLFAVKDNQLFEMKLDVSGQMPFLLTTIDIALGAALHPIPSEQLELPAGVS